MKSLRAEDIEPLLSIEEVARIVGRTHWTLRLDYKAGRLRCVRIGRRLMVEPAEVRRIITEGMTGMRATTAVKVGT